MCWSCTNSAIQDRVNWLIENWFVDENTARVLIVRAQNTGFAGWPNH
jgi:hypothetical protein